MATLVPVNPKLDASGAVPAGGTAASAGGDKFPRRSGDVAILVRNTSGGAITVTFESFAAPGPGEQELDLPIVVPAASERFIGPFPQAFANADGDVEATYSTNVGLKIDALDLG